MKSTTEYIRLLKQFKDKKESNILHFDEHVRKKLLRKLGILRGILFICRIKSLRYEVNHRIHPFVEAIQG